MYRKNWTCWNSNGDTGNDIREWFCLIIQFIYVYRNFRYTISYWVLFFLHELAFSNITRILKVILSFPRSLILTSVLVVTGFRKRALHLFFYYFIVLTT